MKHYQGALIAALTAMGLAACSSMDMSGMGTHGTRADTAAAASNFTNGSGGGGADNSYGNNAGTGNSGVQPNGR
jgi:hypothetical protein